MRRWWKRYRFVRERRRTQYALWSYDWSVLGESSSYERLGALTYYKLMNNIGGVWD